MFSSLRHLIAWAIQALGSPEELVLENLALREQLLALHANRPCRRLMPMHKLFWVFLRRFWPVRTVYHSPWQNGVAERWVGSYRRDLLDHVIVLNERHLKRLMTEYVLPQPSLTKKQRTEAYPKW
jgi:hypothetical protein